jgi:site-specific DNA-methyltransferase (cytosine-N4-specific)
MDLKSFLAAIVRHSGDKAMMQRAVWSSPVRTIPSKEKPTRRRASLPLEAARQYGLLDDNYCATDLAKRLVNLENEALYAEFARHVLLSCRGLRVVEATLEMKRDGLVVTGDSLAEYLSNQGVRVTIHNTAINSMRLWLEKAGVFEARSWKVDTAKMESLVGLTRTEIAALVGLTEEQQAFVLALCRINPEGPYPAAAVRELAEQILGRLIPRDSLPKRVLHDLTDMGLIEFRSKGTRGGKSAVLKTTDRFRREMLEEFLEKTAQSLDPLLTAYYIMSPAEIYRDLGARDRGVRGKALEAYAIHVMRLMGFRFLGWRKRAKESTGNAEVDVVMSGLFGNSPTRWQVQCKNTPSGNVDLEDVAKEVGLVSLTKATHILIVANCRYTRAAREFALEVMRATPLTLFLLDWSDFEKIRKSPGALASVLRAQAAEMLRIKRPSTVWGW